MKLYIGCYTKKISEEIVGRGDGIYVLEFDPSNGSVTFVDYTKTINPSYLAISSDGKVLFALEESPIEESPKIRSFRIGASASGEYLELISEQELPGSYACHLRLSPSEDHLIVGAYMSGNILAYPVTSDGQIGKNICNIAHEGQGPNKMRQEAPHVHFIQPVENNEFFAVDLGIDAVRSYQLVGGMIKEQPEKDIRVNAGSGPRHMVLSLSGNHAFIFSELDAKIHVFKKIQQTFEFLDTYLTLPSDYDGQPSGAAIRIHPNGKFIYTSNRGYNGITLFHFDESNEKLFFVEHVPSGGKTPRDMNIDPDGKWLVCANQDSDNLVVFSIDQESGKLNEVYTAEVIKTPSCVLFGK